MAAKKKEIQNTEKTEAADPRTTNEVADCDIEGYSLKEIADKHLEELYTKEHDRYNSMPLGIEASVEDRKTYIKNIGLLKNAIRYKCWETCACYCRLLAGLLDSYPPTPVELPKDCYKSDMVNHPPHYNVGGFEVIDIIKTFTEGLEGIQAVDTANAIKYILRWHRKNGVEDLKKAKWYIEHLIKEMENETD